jgi:hypothetical protein
VLLLGDLRPGVGDASLPPPQHEGPGLRHCSPLLNVAGNVTGNGLIVPIGQSGCLSTIFWVLTYAAAVFAAETALVRPFP